MDLAWALMFVAFSTAVGAFCLYAEPEILAGMGSTANIPTRADVIRYRMWTVGVYFVALPVGSIYVVYGVT